MKIAFFVTGFPKLSETFILNQIVGLLDKGHDVRILSFEKEYGISHDTIAEYGLVEKTTYLLPESESRYMKVLKLAFWSLSGMLKKGVARKGSLRETVNHYAALGKHSRVGNYDVVIAHFGPVGVQALNLRLDDFFTGKLATVFHGYDISRYQVLETYTERYRKLFREGELFLPISQLWSDRLQSLGCPPDKIMLHRMGVDPENFAWIDRCKHESGEALRFLSVARLAPKKGIDDAIKALAELKVRGYTFEYEVIGGGDQLDRYKTLAASLNVSEEVSFLGERTQTVIREKMAKAHFFLLPSKVAFDGDMEGIPVALMEAMCLGLPVISSTHSGIPELIEHGVTGFLAIENDSASLANVVQEAVDTPPDRIEIIRDAAREKVNKEFNKVHLIDELEEILSRVAAS
ncbi:glycosyltransferase [Larsenimonas rhizosphaerae]|uniref:Glycosyltransferase n=1 Tax=Larsenimonas rhizosphaerae TaxID=2944682 RepID=A0AA41ZK78_9GAMM|nr:glycosyltransferase [Larsenimonas rhizosphaerae]MCM2130463.1 glycosyltransferase [Larsenimonas rhizosphaerae]MCX2523168.1 glycosyltransferase [Larsenimonas rhizosphaerae]